MGHPRQSANLQRCQYSTSPWRCDIPETYGIPDPEPTRIEQAQLTINEAIAGQGVVRRIVLYVLAGGLAVSPLPGLAVLALILLMATDSSL